MTAEASRLQRPLATRCERCRLTFYPPREFCAECGGASGSASLPSEGAIHAFTTIHLDAFGHTAPYRLAYVDLDGGGRVLVGLQPASGPVSVGDRVILDQRSGAGVVATRKEI